MNSKILSAVRVALGMMIAISFAPANAAIGLDRTRLVYPANEKSVSLVVMNKNDKLPYLAQGWLEDESGTKLEGAKAAFAVLPPLQRVEPSAQTQVKVQALPAAQELPKDRESVFYFNLREIPPKSDKENALQIALQTRIKMFYRPADLAAAAAKLQATPFQEQITLKKQAKGYTIHNPTPYYVTIIGASSKKGGDTVEGFESLMVSPKSSADLKANMQALGANPVLSYVNDFGGQVALVFDCDGEDCKVNTEKSKN